MNKADLSERDICTKLINPAIEQAKGDLQTQFREKVSFTAERAIVGSNFVEAVVKELVE